MRVRQEELNCDVEDEETTRQMMEETGTPIFVRLHLGFLLFCVFRFDFFGFFGHLLIRFEKKFYFDEKNH